MVYRSKVIRKQKVTIMLNIVAYASGLGSSDLVSLAWVRRNTKKLLKFEPYLRARSVRDNDKNSRAKKITANILHAYN